MPERETVRRARRDSRRGKALSTQAGEFVREEVHHVREGKHGARSTKQAIAIGLSKARQAGVRLPPPKKGAASASTRKSAKRALARGRTRAKTSKTRSRGEPPSDGSTTAPYGFSAAATVRARRCTGRSAAGGAPGRGSPLRKSLRPLRR